MGSKAATFMEEKLKEEILDELEDMVLFGFDNQEELFENIKDMFYDEELDNAWLMSNITERMAKHLEESSHWQEPTDFQKLLSVFDQLNREGIVSLHNPAYMRSDAEFDCVEMMNELEQMGVKVKGYCYYHTQDLGRAIQKNGNLMLGYDSKNEVDEIALEVANRITELLTQKGFSVDWNGSVDTRIEITTIDWKKVPDGVDYNYGHIFELLGKKPKTSKKPFWKFW